MKTVIGLVLVAIIGVILGTAISLAATHQSNTKEFVCVSAVGPVDQNGNGNTTPNLKCEERK